MPHCSPKSVQITFTLRKGQCPPVKINNVEIPVAAVTKYLGMHLDHKLNWRDHTVTKRKEIDLKVKKKKNPGYLVGSHNYLYQTSS